MSNSPPNLNGENTGGVADFTTDASVNMVAAIHDHITCAKPVPVDSYTSQDSKTGIMTYSCDFDHMYASLTEGNTVQKDGAEVKHLKELLLLHLDLIQQQSEQLVTKDKQIAALRQENETLRQRLERMDRRVTLQKHREGAELFVSSVENSFNLPSTTSPPFPVACSSRTLSTPPPLVEDCGDTITLPLDLLENVTIMNTDSLVSDSSQSTLLKWDGSKRRRRDGDNVSTGSRRQRLTSWTSSNNDATPEVKKEPNENRRIQKKIRTKGGGVTKKDAVLTTERLYYTPVGEASVMWGCEEEQETSVSVENMVVVPSWRTKVYTSCYSMEGTENLDDEVFNKRHQRLEIDERRRKRWDVQRIREQRQIDKLRQREEAAKRRAAAAARHHGDGEDPISSLWPLVDDAEYLEVTENLPVSAFGLPIIQFTASEFSLPWLSSARCKAPSIHTHTARRRLDHNKR